MIFRQECRLFPKQIDTHLFFRSPIFALLLEMETPHESELIAIYGVYATPILLKGAAAAIKSRARVESLVGAIVHTFARIKSAFRAADHFHYAFTPRDLTNWVCALMRYSITGTSRR